MKMEKEEIAKRLKEAWEKDEDVTIVVRTGVHETQEIPLVRTQAREPAAEPQGTRAGESNWEVLKERGKERECEVVVKTFKEVDTKGNETVIVEMYRMENIEGITETKARG